MRHFLIILTFLAVLGLPTHHVQAAHVSTGRMFNQKVFMVGATANINFCGLFDTTSMLVCTSTSSSHRWGEGFTRDIRVTRVTCRFQPFVSSQTGDSVTFSVAKGPTFVNLSSHEFGYSATAFTESWEPDVVIAYAATTSDILMLRITAETDQAGANNAINTSCTIEWEEI